VERRAPLLASWRGYLPSSLLGMGEDLPLGVYRDRRRWRAFPHYLFSWGVMAMASAPEPCTPSWLEWRSTAGSGASASTKARREYVLTEEGARVLAQIRDHIEELYEEVVQGREGGGLHVGETAGSRRRSSR
jgi:hypothetical protein